MATTQSDGNDGIATRVVLSPASHNPQRIEFKWVWVSAVLGTIAVTGVNFLLLIRLTVYVNKVDKNGDPDLLQLVELETKELLDHNNFKRDSVTLVRGSALMALNETNDKLGKDSIVELLKSLDKHYAK